MNEQVDQPKEILLEGEILEEYLEDHEKAMTISEQIREEFNDVDPLTMLLDQDLFLKYQWKVMERDAYQTIATAKLIYGRFHHIFNSKGWKNLAKHGSRLQRPLWDSSNDPRYVHSLMGPNTIHSLPTAHITTFLEESPMTDTLMSGQDEAQQTLADLKKHGVDLQAIEKLLQTDAIEEIRQSYHLLADAVIRRRDKLADTF